jgi:octaprenyl-diphosphate synthase
MREAATAQRDLIRNAITARNADTLAEVIDAVQRGGSLAYTRAQAQLYHDRALALLEQLPPGSCRAALERLTFLSIHRDH